MSDPQLHQVAGEAANSEITVRPARTTDVPGVKALVDPLVERRVLVAKETVAYYEGLQGIMVAEHNGRLVGCGALHVMWQDLAEVRTLAVAPGWLDLGVGHRLVEELIARARELGVSRLFCLTFEVDFFRRHDFAPMTEAESEPSKLGQAGENTGHDAVTPEVYAELLRSPDEGVAEFLDLARVKPNTLGNTRMIRRL